MSTIQNAASATAAASFVASQIGSSVAGTFGMGYAKLVVGQAAWAAAVGALGEKLAEGTATGGDYANVVQKTGDLLLGLGLTIAQVNPWVRGAFAIASGGLFIYNNWDNISDFYDRIKSKTQSASTIPSPIVLDLDGDGVETISVANGAWFDHAADGFAERTGWAGSDDGLLVRDLDGNGRIDSGRELFGSETLLPNGTKAANGFEALKALDANADGVIDTQDAAFAELRVWKDANANGRTDAGELLTLDEAGVSSINVAYANSSHTDAQGNAHRQVGSYTTTSGETRAATDIWVQTNPTQSLPTEWVIVPADISALPDAQFAPMKLNVHHGTSSNNPWWRVAA